MLKESIKLIATELANNGITLDNTPNSVFAATTYITEDSSSENDTALVDKISTIVGNTIALFKNKYIPSAMEYKSTVASIVTDKIGALEIVNKDIVKIYVNELLTELISRDIIGGEGSYVELPISTLVVPLPEENIKDYFKSDLPVLDSYLKNMLEAYDDNQLINIWEKYLLNVSGSNIAINNIRAIAPINVDEITLLFMLVRNLKNNIPDNVNVKETVYTNIMNNFYDKLHNDLIYIYKDIVYLNSVNRVIIKVTDDNIYVNKNSYNKFMKENSIDAILGFSVSKYVDDASKYGLDSLVIESANYVTLWNNYVKLKKLAIDEVGIYRLAYTMAVEEVYKDADDAVVNALQYENSTLAQNAVNTYLSTLDLSTLQNVAETSKDIYSRILIDDNNFKLYVDSMYNYMKSITGVTVKEAASLATLDIILEYLLAQVIKK